MLHWKEPFPKNSLSRVLALWEDYKTVTKPFWKAFPEYLAIGFELCYYGVPRGTMISHKIRGVKSSIRQCVRYIKSAKRMRPKPPQCDVLLFHSSMKPSVQPAMDILAEKLARKGFRCAVIHATRDLHIWSQGGHSEGAVRVQSFDDFSSWMQGGVGFPRTVWVVVRATFLSFFQIFLFLARKPNRLFIPTKHFSQTWYLLLCSAYHREALRPLLQLMDPKLIIVNNERVPFALELFSTRYSRKPRRILFLSELIYRSLDPIISDELWVWNDDAKNALNKVTNIKDDQVIHVVGNAESNWTLSLPKENMILSDLIQSDDATYFHIFLSQFPLYSYLDDVDTEEATKKSVEWLIEAKEHCPNWYFIFKTRPYHHKIQADWLRQFESQDNCIIIRDELSFNQILVNDRCLAVSSLMSIGLFVASALGKAALRFMVSSKQTTVPVVDDVSTPIASANHLIQILRRLEREHESDCPLLPLNRPREILFPHLGTVPDRLEQLCLLNLTETPQRVVNGFS